MSVDDNHAHDVVEEENYFISMTDMMVGLVFIFIILLMYFAVQLNRTKEDLDKTRDTLTNADQTRTEILKDLERSLKKEGIEVSIDTQNGVLRLPEALLFNPNESVLPQDRVPKLNLVAEALASILPAYTDIAAPSEGDSGPRRPEKAHKIEAVFIEGHTDDTGLVDSNWVLSAARAITTFKAITAHRLILSELCSKRRSGDCVPILSVSGYGFSRPVDGGRVEPNDPVDVKKRKRDQNRRIDIRILMKAPLSDEVREPIERQLNDTP
jgi:chemotaxis protein MotB